jgi:hypothetical protein
LSVGIEISVHFGKLLTVRRGKYWTIFVRLGIFGKVVDREEGKTLELMVLSPRKSPFSLMAGRVLNIY